MTTNTMPHDDLQSVELTDDMLDAVSGGELHEFQKLLLDAMIKGRKDRGESVDGLLDWAKKRGEGRYEIDGKGFNKWVEGKPQQEVDDMVEYILQHW